MKLYYSQPMMVRVEEEDNGQFVSFTNIDKNKSIVRLNLGSNDVKDITLNDVEEPHITLEKFAKIAYDRLVRRAFAIYQNDSKTDVRRIKELNYQFKFAVMQYISAISQKSSDVLNKARIQSPQSNLPDFIKRHTDFGFKFDIEAIQKELFKFNWYDIADNLKNADFMKSSLMWLLCYRFNSNPDSRAINCPKQICEFDAQKMFKFNGMLDKDGTLADTSKLFFLQAICDLLKKTTYGSLVNKDTKQTATSEARDIIVNALYEDIYKYAQSRDINLNDINALRDVHNKIYKERFHINPVKEVEATSGGAQRHMSLRKTTTKINTKYGVRCIYTGTKGGKYIKVNNKFIRYTK